MTDRENEHGPTEPTPPQEPTTPPQEPAPPTEPAPTTEPAEGPPPTPVVAWEMPAPAYVPPAPGSGSATGYAADPPFSIGAILSDCFAIYGADPIRFAVLAIVTSAVSLLGSLASSPFARGGFQPDAAGAAGLLGILGFVVGVVGGSTTLALAEGGPTMPADRVLRRGIERSGWLFLTSLLIGIGAIVVILVPIVFAVLIALFSPALGVVLGLVVMLVVVWLGLRVSLALPANVVDNLNSIEGLKVSWRVTRQVGVWARLLGAGFLLGLLFVPAAAGFGLAALVATLAGNPWLVVLASVALVAFTPLTSLLTYAAYRRLVAPIAPSWAAAAVAPPAAPIDAPPPMDVAASPAPVEAPPPAEAPQPPEAPVPVDAAPAAAPDGRPVFRPRPFGTVARALLATIVVLDVAGVAAIGWAAGELASGRVTFPTWPTSPRFPGFPGIEGAVDPGSVAFGTSSDLDTCTIQGQGFAFDASDPIVWMASFEDRVTTADEVFVRVSRNGTELDTTLQDPGTYDCLGVEAASTFDPGVYVFEVLVNGELGASGTVFVQ